MSDDSENKGRELLNRAVASAMARFGAGVYPIYAFPETEPVFIGSCFAIEHRGRRFLLTAAHVMDNHHHAQLAVGDSTAMYSIGGFVFSVNPVGGDRDEDPFDFAWHELSSDEAQHLKIISSADLDLSESPPTGKAAYTATGYPLSKNKKISPAERKKRKLASMRVQYTDFRLDAPALFARRGMTPETHIAIQRGQRALDESGHEDNTIGHKGLSGGPLVDVGLKAPYGESGPQRVVGILIENDDEETLILAVRLWVVLREIDKVIAAETSGGS